ncbi:uncharacterized protein LOC144445606 [Glandiceps talaboti]
MFRGNQVSPSPDTERPNKENGSSMATSTTDVRVSERTDIRGTCEGKGEDDGESIFHAFNPPTTSLLCKCKVDDYADEGRKRLNSKLIAYFKYSNEIKRQDVNEFLRLEADINCEDEHGQTVLHETTARYSVDLVKFLISKGADINKYDKSNRKPIHVAAAFNQLETLKVLLGKDNSECKAEEKEKALQKGIFIAASNNAEETMERLITELWEISKVRHVDFQDKMERTPLMAAVRAGCPGTCRKLLIDYDANPTIIDKSKESPLQLIALVMPDLMQEIIQRGFIDDRNVEKEPCCFTCGEKDEDPTPVDSNIWRGRSVQYKDRYVLSLIKQKWNDYGRNQVIYNGLMNFIVVIAWSTLALIKIEGRACYDFPRDILRVALGLFAIVLSVRLWGNEIQKFRLSKRKYFLWKKAVMEMVTFDKKNGHYRYDQRTTNKKILLEMDEVKVNNLKSWFLHAVNLWNYFNWVTYMLLLVCVAFHVIDIFTVSDDLCRSLAGNVSYVNEQDAECSTLTDEEMGESIASRIHIRIFAVTIILLWVRLFNHLQHISFFNLIIGKFQQLLWAIVFASIIYIIFYLAYFFAFWMIFGGDVEGFTTVSETLFSLFRMSLVDEYNYDGLKCKAPVMCDILVGTYLGLVALIVVSFFIGVVIEVLSPGTDNERQLARWDLKSELVSFYEPSVNRENLVNQLKKLDDVQVPKEEGPTRENENQGVVIIGNVVVDGNRDDLTHCNCKCDRLQKQYEDNYKKLTEEIKKYHKSENAYKDKIIELEKSYKTKEKQLEKKYFNKEEQFEEKYKTKEEQLQANYETKGERLDAIVNKLEALQKPEDKQNEKFGQITKLLTHIQTGVKIILFVLLKLVRTPAEVNRRDVATQTPRGEIITTFMH